MPVAADLRSGDGRRKPQVVALASDDLQAASQHRRLVIPQAGATTGLLLRAASPPLVRRGGGPGPERSRPPGRPAQVHPLPVEEIWRTLVVTPSRRDAMAESQVQPVRAGEIGPVRREIIFEPLGEPGRRAPAPVEPTPAAPDTPPQEPVPVRP